MTALIIIGIVLLAFLLIGQIRLGVSADYSEAGLYIVLKIGPAKIGILPAKGKKETSKKVDSVSTEKEQQAKKANIKDTLTLAKEFIPLIGEAAGRLKRKIRIDDLFLSIVWGSSDPAAAAMGYGAASAAMGTIWPIIEYNFRVKRHELHIDVDFDRTVPTLAARARITLTFGQLLAFVLRMGIKALKIYLGIRRDKSQEEAVQV